MSWDTPLDDMEMDFESFARVKPGRYHARIQAVTFDQKNQMVVDYEILAGDKSELGKVHRDYFSPSVNSRKRALQIAVASKVTSVEELEELQKQHRPFSNYAAMVGKHIKIELAEEEYQGKTRTKCGFGIWSIDNPKVSDIPVNRALLDSSGGVGSGSNPFDDDPFKS